MTKKKEHRLDVRLTDGGNHLLNELAELLGIDKTDVVEIALRHYARAWDLPLNELMDAGSTSEVDAESLSEPEKTIPRGRTLPGLAT